ncbi:formate dehydrogenase accessory sulfurtransferase FdhD [Dyadobacter sp. Leaf189]|uniref:formate dehydrogenase accessory sulfurtransferase FdhD n=1 Tax=Dyadobacter sp. Leaf189 TaxID=1736295 RepID=UPI0006FEE5AC|nr:formate dehydrogenase accessory sulfurtransferase FdhD [Dyadobacter sp. Leaf189]KQS31216.1 formate dehydrogenase family accessory protein FdhD [Dyadobacter sp. Leaf189]
MVKTPPASVMRRQIRRVTSYGTDHNEDFLAVEEPLEIRVAFRQNENASWQNISVTMRTPGNDHELAAGFLFTEGIIQDLRQIKKVENSVFEKNLVLVTLADSCVPNLHNAERNFYTTSSCGVCGKASIEAVKTVSRYVLENTLLVTREVLFGLAGKISGSQRVFEETGGLHAAALFDRNGNLLNLREDVGRHNALDKLIGAALLSDQLPLAGNMLLLSGRASFELIQKALMAGIEMVVSIGAPSSLAVQLAEDNKITLAGFLKQDRFNVYTGFHRISGL